MKSTYPLHYYHTMTTPAGEFTFAVDETGAATATAFGNIDRLRERAPRARYQANAERTSTLRAEIERYFTDPHFVFDAKVNGGGTPFQERVWAALRAIPAGETRSYGELARELGSSPRAVGQANATNPICLLVPCHRVVGSDGSLTGFAFGEDIKRRLLEHEGAPVRTLATA